MNEKCPDCGGLLSVSTEANEWMAEWCENCEPSKKESQKLAIERLNELAKEMRETIDEEIDNEWVSNEKFELAKQKMMEKEEDKMFEIDKNPSLNDELIRYVRSWLPKEFCGYPFYNVYRSYVPRSRLEEWVMVWRNNDGDGEIIEIKFEIDDLIKSKHSGHGFAQLVADKALRAIQDYKEANPGEFEVVCVDALGMEEWFDEGITYLAEDYDEDNDMVFVYDRCGVRREVFWSRFQEVIDEEEVIKEEYVKTEKSYVDCNFCRGRGRWAKQECGWCHGTGQMEVTKSVDLDFTSKSKMGVDFGKGESQSFIDMGEVQSFNEVNNPRRK